MKKKIILVEEYVLVENKDDLFFVFDHEFLKSMTSPKANFYLDTKKHIFIFKDPKKIPLDKLKKLKTVGIVINQKEKEKETILEANVVH